MKYLIATALFALPLSAQAQTQEDATRGYIDGAFSAMDADKNGNVSRAEFDTFMRARLARQAQAFDAAFASFDKNRNGQIEKTEAAAAPALLENFAAVDSDGNGTISKDELRAAMIAAQSAEAGVQ